VQSSAPKPMSFTTIFDSRDGYEVGHSAYVASEPV
jgi:hypothetical protein